MTSLSPLVLYGGVHAYMTHDPYGNGHGLAHSEYLWGKSEVLETIQKALRQGSSFRERKIHEISGWGIRNVKCGKRKQLSFTEG